MTKAKRPMHTNSKKRLRAAIEPLSSFVKEYHGFMIRASGYFLFIAEIEASP
jgi:hypothetical protein